MSLTNSLEDNREKAEDFFEYLIEYLENFDDIDIDETAQGLLIKSPIGNYLLNYHGVTKQIWLASPAASRKPGAHHFNYHPSKSNDWQNSWICSRTNRTIQDVMINEILESAGE